MARLAVETRRGLNSCSTSRACEMEANSSFGDLSFRFIGEGDTIHKIELSSTNSNFKMRVQTTTLISVCNQFGEFSVNIFIRIPEEEMDTNPKSSSKERCAFFLMMGNANERGRPNKKDLARNNVDEIYNELLDYYKSGLCASTARRRD